MKTSRLFQLTFAAASLMFALGAGSASADFKFCNKTNKTVYINFVSPDGNCSALGKWSAWGWYVAAPNKCVTTLSGKLNNRYYYYFAHSLDNAYVWTNSTYRWWEPDAAHNGRCINSPAGNGGAYYNHREVDTGAATDYTANLTSGSWCSAYNCNPSPPDLCACGI
jgi:uncharacterized membrane protein